MVRGAKPSEARSRGRGDSAAWPTQAGAVPLGNGPMTPAYCRMFLDARRILGLSERDLAQRLATDIGTIRALESGQLAALPPWPETSRVVTAYLAGLGMDPRPVLHSLAQDLAAVTPMQATATPTAAPYTHADAMRRPDERPADKKPGVKAAAAAGGRLGRAPAAAHRAAKSAMAAGRNVVRRAGGQVARRAGGEFGNQVRDQIRVVGWFASRRGRWSKRTAFGAVVCFALAAAVAQSTFAGSVMTAATAPLPATVTRALGKMADLVRTQLAPVRDGLRWIEVEDPRSRRGDKLQTARR